MILIIVEEISILYLNISEHLYDTNIKVSYTNDTDDGQLCGITSNGIWVDKNGNVKQYSEWYYREVTVECSSKLIGQYVTLKRQETAPEKTVINICEVMVWGYKYEGDINL